MFKLAAEPKRWAPYFKGKNVVPVPATIPPQDLYMLTQFRYHIIANSTFSWWGGAWLSDFDDKIVIAPKPWIYNAQSASLLDASWVPLGYIEPWNIRFAKLLGMGV